MDQNEPDGATVIAGCLVGVVFLVLLGGFVLVIGYIALVIVYIVLWIVGIVVAFAALWGLFHFLIWFIGYIRQMKADEQEAERRAKAEEQDAERRAKADEQEAKWRAKAEEQEAERRAKAAPAAAKEYYNILNVGEDASQDDIKKVFRKLAHQCHPDKVGGDGAKFRQAYKAYQVLNDEKKRAQYDQFGSEAFSAGGGSAYGGDGSACADG